MKLTVLTDRHDPSTASEFARAARNLTKSDPAEVNAFCDRLTGLKGKTPDDICDEVDDLELPSGYMHVRVFDAADGFQIVGIISRNCLPVSGREVAIMVTHQERFSGTRWVSTTALPILDRGVLDLLVHFEPCAQFIAA